MINVETAKSEITDVIETIEKWIPMFEQGNAPAVLADVMELLDSKQVEIERLKKLRKEQQPKKGHWEMNSDYPDRLICSECNSQFDVWHWESKQMHFCPNCGTDMRKDGE